MSFEVDTDALLKFAGFLESFGQDAYWLQQDIKSLPMTDHGEGLLSEMTGFHDDCVDGMSTRMGVMSEIGEEAHLEVQDAVYWVYEKHDKAAAAKMDELYPGASDKGSLPSGDGSSKGGFTYKDVSEDIDVEAKDIDDLEPKAGELEEFVRYWSDRGSYMYHAREILRAICLSVGLCDETDGDPITFLVQGFSGDWRVWVECALHWKALGRSVEKMAEQFDPALVKLQEMWQGNAADAAVEYFAKLQKAMGVEAETYEHLYEKYKLAAEFVYETQTYINDFVNTVFDLAIDLVLVLMTGGGAAPGIVVKDVVGAILTGTTVIIQQVKAAETIIQALSMEDPPACELPDLPGEGKHRLYDHPSEAV